MTYRIASYQNLSAEEKVKFFKFCENESKETSQLSAINMWNENWDSKENTLLHLLEKTKKFHRNRGEMFILYYCDQVIACGGVCKSNISDLIAIGGVRMWITKEHRNNSILREYLLPVHKKWAIARGYKQLALSFNEYNKNIIQIFKRTRLAEKSGRIESRQPHHLFYSGLNEVPFPIMLYKSKQWVIYEALDPDWKFDWSAYEFIETDHQSL
jgi:hypothetical protein